jgi:nucleotide-binding universal stress UspA family protein
MSACIVCGVDGSHEADRAAAVAARLARDLGSRAVLVHVQARASRVPRPGRRRRRRRMLKATAAASCFPRDTHVRLESGDPTAELLTAAREEDAELLVVATGGLGTASPVLLGGTASALMRESPCPVVCAIEGRPGDAAVLGLAGDLATRLGGDLHAVSDSDVGIDPREFSFDAALHVVHAAADEAIKSVADHVRAGLVVVGAPNEGDPGRGLNVPLAIALAADGDIPIVVLAGAAKLHVGSGHYELAASAA